MPIPIVIDSSNRTTDSNSTSDFNVNIRAINNIRCIKFKKICLKYAWLPILGEIDEMTVIESVSGATTISSPIPSGSWTATNIATALQTNINVGTTNTYTVVYDPIEFKYTITRSAGAETFQITFPTNSKLWKIIGLEQNGTAAGLTTITSPNVGYTLGADYFIVRSNNLLSGANEQVRGYQSLQLFGSDNRLTNEQNIYLTIPVNVGLGSTIIYTEDQIDRVIHYTPISGGKSNKWLDRIDFVLIDPILNTVIDMQGATIMIELEAEVDY